MKYRADFVTNSSSSSFICVVCGNVESGYGVELRDVGMVECENGHTFCEHHLLPKTTDEKESAYDMPATRCPICQLKVINTENLISYLEKEKSLMVKEIEDEIRKKFPTYKEFTKFLEKK